MSDLETGGCCPNETKYYRCGENHHGTNKEKLQTAKPMDVMGNVVMLIQHFDKTDTVCLCVICQPPSSADE